MSKAMDALSVGRKRKRKNRLRNGKGRQEMFIAFP